jgi:hypothetical protein
MRSGAAVHQVTKAARCGVRSGAVASGPPDRDSRASRIGFRTILIATGP